MSVERRAFWQIHFCVLLWGFTAIFGKIISLHAVHLVWWRMLLVTLALLAVPIFWRGVRSLTPRLFGAYTGIGAVLALHWLTFYQSIKLSNASVAATCMAFAPITMALLEPWLTGSRFKKSDLLLGVVSLPGMALVLGGIPDGMHAGFWLGALSASLTAVVGALNKRYIAGGDAWVVSGIELGMGFLLVALLAPWLLADQPAVVLPDARDFALLLVLAIACTLVPFVLSLRALRHVPAFTTTLALNLEPVYAIAIAALFLGESRDLGGQFYLGVSILLAAVFSHAWLLRSSESQRIPLN
jgi:drug/metabolite transporter (DMT)-like permease